MEGCIRFIESYSMKMTLLLNPTCLCLAPYPLNFSPPCTSPNVFLMLLQRPPQLPLLPATFLRFKTYSHTCSNIEDTRSCRCWNLGMDPNTIHCLSLSSRDVAWSAELLEHFAFYSMFKYCCLCCKSPLQAKTVHQWLFCTRWNRFHWELTCIVNGAVKSILKQVFHRSCMPFLPHWWHLESVCTA